MSPCSIGDDAALGAGAVLGRGGVLLAGGYMSKLALESPAVAEGGAAENGRAPFLILIVCSLMPIVDLGPTVAFARGGEVLRSVARTLAASGYTRRLEAT